MANFKRGDLIKATAARHGAATATAGAATITAAYAAAIADAANDAADQYWYAYYDKSIGLVVKADADHIWIRWFGSRSDHDTHKYYNKTKYFKLVSRNDQF